MIGNIIFSSARSIRNIRSRISTVSLIRAAWVLLKITLLLYSMVCFSMYLFQERLIFLPSHCSRTIEESNLADTRELFLITEDGYKLQTWYKKPQSGKPLLIFFPGQRGNVAHGYLVELYKQFIKEGYGFISLSWRGFGNSTGSPTVSGIYKDADTIIQFVEEEGYNMKDVLVIGYSMGTAPAIQVSNRYKHRGLMLIAPFRSIGAMAMRRYPAIPEKYLLKDECNFDNINYISTLLTPVAFVHGDKDLDVPMEESEILADRSINTLFYSTLKGENHKITPHKVMNDIELLISKTDER